MFIVRLHYRCTVYALHKCTVYEINIELCTHHISVLCTHDTRTYIFVIIIWVTMYSYGSEHVICVERINTSRIILTFKALNLYM